MKQTAPHTISVRTMLIFGMIMLIWALPAQASLTAPDLKKDAPELLDSNPRRLFLQYIPQVAEQFIGMPFKFGGRPRSSGTTDNSSLFFAIYTMAARNAGLAYREYLPMYNLLENTGPVDPAGVQNGDLIVLDNNLAAMVYQVDPSGRMHFIYASKKRQQVISFHSDNLVYQAYWLEHLKGFFRLNDHMLSPR